MAKLQITLSCELRRLHFRFPVNLVNCAHLLLHPDLHALTPRGQRSRLCQVDVGSVELWVVGIQQDQHCFVRNSIEDFGVLEDELGAAPIVDRELEVDVERARRPGEAAARKGSSSLGRRSASPCQSWRCDIRHGQIFTSCIGTIE